MPHSCRLSWRSIGLVTIASQFVGAAPMPFEPRCGRRRARTGCRGIVVRWRNDVSTFYQPRPSMREACVTSVVSRSSVWSLVPGTRKAVGCSIERRRAGDPRDCVTLRRRRGDAAADGARFVEVQKRSAQAGLAHRVRGCRRLWIRNRTGSGLTNTRSGPIIVTAPSRDASRTEVAVAGPGCPTNVPWRRHNSARGRVLGGEEAS